MTDARKRLTVILTTICLLTMPISQAMAASPSAVDDAMTSDGTTPASINVLTNDTDPDGDTLIVTDVTSSTDQGGTAECEESGECAYYPPARTGSYTDSFDYEVYDGKGGTDIGTVTVTVGGPAGTTHPRAVTLRLRRHIIARGTLTTPDGFDECSVAERVLVQRRTTRWKTVATATTSDTGTFRAKLPDKPGKYRAKVKSSIRTSPEGTNCATATSAIKRHSH